MRNVEKRLREIEDKLTPSVQMGVIYAPPDCSEEYKEKQRQVYYDRYGRNSKINFFVVNYGLEEGENELKK